MSVYSSIFTAETPDGDFDLARSVINDNEIRVWIEEGDAMAFLGREDVEGLVKALQEWLVRTEAAAR